ncbi:hypothetical protein F2Q69_00013760 [Brassica cretica]|uniref:Uncharacterized protein n=1 Tax=Brassica cretica TaxID=69181 RepID=A0A8S9R0J9_BRACR|nr:hypothetical protein F2Q69_00013760 [Brassica cretica]
MLKIDVARLNALRPKPKPSEQPPDTVRTPSVDGDDPMEEDRVSTGRTLRRRKEKVARHLKRGLMKRKRKISKRESSEFLYISHSKKLTTTTDCGCSSEKPERKKKTLGELQGIEFPHALCDTGASARILPRVMADHLGLKVESSQELFTFVDCSQKSSGGIVRDLEVQIGNALVPVDFHVLDIKLNWNSSLLLGRAFLSTVGAVCNLQTNQLCLTLIDPNAHYDPILVKKPHTIPRRINDPGIIAACHCGAESTDIAFYKPIDTDLNHVRDGDYSIGSWTDEHHHESFAVETTTHTPGANKVFTDEELLNMQRRDHTSQTLIIKHRSTDVLNNRSRSTTPRRSTTIKSRKPLDPNGFVKAIDGCTLHISREDIADMLQRDAPSLFTPNVSKDSWKERDETSYICLPEHASSFTQTKLAAEIYTKDEINEMFYGICGEHERDKEAFQLKLDGVYYPLNDSISWLTTCMEEMKQDIARIQNVTNAARHPSIDRRQPKSIDSHQSPSLDRHHPTSIDNRYAASIAINQPHPHTMKSLTDFHTRKEIHQLVEGIYRALETTEKRLNGRCDDIYFPMDLTISALTSKVEAIQGELVEIQSYIARRPEASILIDRRNNKSIDTSHPTLIDIDTNRGRLVPKTTSETSNTPYHEKEISADTYAALTKHQFNLESLGQRLQRIENTTAAMKDKWRRGDDAMRDFTGTWFNKRKDEMDTCFPTSPNSPHY